MYWCVLILPSLASIVTDHTPVATERFIVHRSLLPALELALKTRIDALHLASSLPTDPSDRPIDCGSMISNARFDDLERRVQQAVKMGARLLCGGKRVDGERDEAFFEPTLLADVTMEMDVASEEGRSTDSIREMRLADIALLL
jgi:acyl-CoA reductase-like NAD-dependent aldehyde dehydrogenase